MAFTAELLRRCCHSLVFTPEVSLTHWTHQSPQILVAETGTNRKDKSGTLLKTNFNNYVLVANPGLFSGGGAPLPPLKNEFNLVSWFISEGGRTSCTSPLDQPLMYMVAWRKRGVLQVQLHHFEQRTWKY